MSKPVSAIGLANVCADYLDSFVHSEFSFEDLDDKSHEEYQHYRNKLINLLHEVNINGVEIDV